eukprot:TRINITY_DN1060_c0_g1_i12.p3 TRINITY_DN1060_c0_g1~~TRINITY_DN1060_c0_g1_i12.p3  ORF type:complete len:178 (+),score=14.77 TRINITY_DN1060_c0_g1_i12:121-654(+)
MNNNSNSKQSLRKLAEELEDRWFLPQGAIHSFVRAHNNSVTMDNLRDFFTDLGLARLWETEGFNLFREYEVGGFVDMKTFMIELDNAHQISMASRLKQADALTRIEQDAANCDKFVGLVAHNEMNPENLWKIIQNIFSSGLLLQQDRQEAHFQGIQRLKWPAKWRGVRWEAINKQEA